MTFINRSLLEIETYLLISFVKQPSQAIIMWYQRFIDAWNDRCAPFTCTKDPDTVIAKATDPRPGLAAA